MSNGTPAEVLAQKIVDAQPFTDDNDATRVWQLFKNEEMAVEFVALILREAGRLSRSLAAGKVVPDGYVLMPRKMTIEMSIAFAETWFSRKRAIDDDDMQDAYDALIESAPPADPAKASGSAPDAETIRLVRDLRWAAGERDKKNRIRMFDEIMSRADSFLSGKLQESKSHG